MRVRQELYSGSFKLLGEEHRQTITVAYNYASSLVDLRRFEEAKAMLRRTMPVARRVLGECDDLTLRMRKVYAHSLCLDAGATAATLDDLREAVTTLEDAARIARRVLGGAHPATVDMESDLRKTRAALGARERGFSVSIEG